jgi:hypothetical protein
MKRIFVSKSAFFNPRALFSFALCSIGLFLAVLVFTAFPSSTALASPDTCATVTFEDHQNTWNGPIFVKLATTTSGCTIYYKINASYPGCPTHGSNPPNPPSGTNGTLIYSSSPSFEGLAVPYGSYRYITASAYKHLAVPTEDSACTETLVENDP